MRIFMETPLLALSLSVLFLAGCDGGRTAPVVYQAGNAVAADSPYSNRTVVVGLDLSGFVEISCPIVDVVISTEEVPGSGVLFYVMDLRSGRRICSRGYEGARRALDGLAKFRDLAIISRAPGIRGLEGGPYVELRQTVQRLAAMRSWRLTEIDLTDLRGTRLEGRLSPMVGDGTFNSRFLVTEWDWLPSTKIIKENGNR